MIYYKVKPEFDNLQKYNGKTVRFDDIWIRNELYTKTELYNLIKKGVYVDYKYFDVVQISKNNTYWFFGARFERGV